jgi:hypothetical protein
MVELTADGLGAPASGLSGIRVGRFATTDPDACADHLRTLGISARHNQRDGRDETRYPGAQAQFRLSKNHWRARQWPTSFVVILPPCHCSLPGSRVLAGWTRWQNTASRLRAAARRLGGAARPARRWNRPHGLAVARPPNLAGGAVGGFRREAPPQPGPVGPHSRNFSARPKRRGLVSGLLKTGPTRSGSPASTGARPLVVDLELHRLEARLDA